MNCLFCNISLDRDDRCNSDQCHPYNVSYHFYVEGHIAKVVFHTFFRNKDLIITWRPMKLKGEYHIEEIYTPLDASPESTKFFFRTVLRFESQEPILTPSNFEKKFPTLLTFS